MHQTAWSRPAWLLAAVVLLATPGLADAQTVPPPGTPPDQIRSQIEGAGLQHQLLEQMRQQGMTPDQVRRELARRGYPSNLLDPYMDETVTRPADPDARVVSAAAALGLAQPTLPDTLDERLRRERDRLERERLMPDSIAIERERGLRIFGLGVFARPSTEFHPMTTGPVPPGYTLGPGDELVLILTGDVERSYVLPVSREGFVVIPQVGQVWVNGLTMAELRNQLYTHLGRAYSGVRRGPEASTQFQVTLGQLRPNQIFVSGQVNRPGAVMVNAVASALNALYEAGGPAPTGSFREIRIMRGNRLVERVDLYDYLLRGDNLSDTRLASGDVLFVPSAAAHVSVHGQVVRPAIYEVLPGETLLDVLGFAGGLNAPAHLRRARIERIVPAEDRTIPGVDRVVLDVDLAEAIRFPERAPAIRPGDAIEIFPVRAEVRRTVAVEGGVWHPGSFGFTPGMRVWDLIDRAEGLREDAYRDRAQIVRVDPQDSTLSVMAVSLRTGPDGRPRGEPGAPGVRHGPDLRGAGLHHPVPGDHLRVRTGIGDPGYTAGIRHGGGGPARPRRERRGSRRAWPGRPTARFHHGGLPGGDDVAGPGPQRRRPKPGGGPEHRGGPAGRSYPARDPPDRGDHPPPGRRLLLRLRAGPASVHGTAPPANGTAGDFVLQPYDRVTIRPLADFELQRSVTVAGEVRYPGTYAMERNDERLARVIERAGGLRDTAFPAGARFYRNGTLVAVDLGEALRRPDRPAISS
jgi:polysaccharide biosynthesis/export protein